MGDIFMSRKKRYLIFLIIATVCVIGVQKNKKPDICTIEMITKPPDSVSYQTIVVTKYSQKDSDAEIDFSFDISELILAVAPVFADHDKKGKLIRKGKHRK
jgi:hypothetical protein